MKITKDTKCCISIAERPGNFGSAIFNATFEKLKLDFIYKPFALNSENLEKAVVAVRVLGIRGCGVSMPHKTNIYRYLDKVETMAEKIGAINTVVNDNGVLTGYNTDYIGANTVLKEYYSIKGKTAHIIGAGGAARAIIVALLEGGASKITISNRDDKNAEKISKEFGVEYCPHEQQSKVSADLFVNATPVGMSPNIEEIIISDEELLKYNAVMDVVVFPFNTKLIEIAKKQGKVVIPGYRMALYQAASQFTLYTGLEAPIDFMLEEMKKIAI